MQEQPSDTPVTQTKTNKILKRGRWTRGLSGALVGVLIFVLGFGFGSGRIGFDAATPNAQNKSLPANLDYSSVEELYDSLKARYDGELDEEKLLDGLKKGLAEATGDPYTVYLTAEEAKEFQAQLNGTFSGIGAELGKDDQDNLIIVAPIGNFPAAQAGLRPQDIVAGINGESTLGMSIESAVSKIRGPKGTDVELEIVRDKKENLKFTITRADIKVDSVKTEILPGDIGYMQISQFGEDTAALARKAADDFKRQGVRGVIVDLRDNPGGLLSASVDVASLWLPKGATVLQQKQGDKVQSTERATGNNPLEGIATVVLVNEGSASASEIVAGALKDHNAATLIGAKTYGKGSVQELEKFSGGSELKVTVARWYRPDGENIDKKGVQPDKEVAMTSEDYKNKRDPQKDAAIEFLR